MNGETGGPVSVPQARALLVEHALLVLIAVSILVAVAPAAWANGPWTWSMDVGYVTLVAAAIHGVAYWRLRLGDFRTAALLMVGGLLGALIAVSFIPGGLPGDRGFAFLTIGVVVAAAVLNARSTAVVAGITMAMLGGLAATRPAYLANQFGEDVIVVLVMSLVLVASTGYRERVQRARTKAAAELDVALQQMEAMLESGPDAMLIIGEDGGIRGLNTRARDWAQRYLGVDARPTDKLPALLGGVRWAQVVPLLHEASTRSRAHQEMEFAWTPGSLWLDVHVRKARGAEDSYVVHLRDITAAKRLESQEREAFTSKMTERSRKDLESARTRLLNRASHEMRTPLTPLRLQVSILERQLVGGGEGRAARSVNTIKRNVARLTRLVDDLLDASALESNELQMQPRALALDSLLATEVDAFRATARGQHLRLTLDCDVVDEVEADPQRLAQVVGNLLSNACKHASSMISVEARLEGDSALVAIADDGNGFDPDHAADLWRPFADGGKPPRATAGSGLGLFICRRIVEQHGGRIWAESKGPGRGARFSFTLPLHASLKYEGTPIANHE